MSWVPHGVPHYAYPAQYFQYFDYLVVIDFEATCHQENPPNFVHEIIQFPAVLVDVQRRAIVDEFNIFCKPTINPTLSDFCTQLTGITQELVDEAPEFERSLEIFREWLAMHHLGTRYRYTIVCDGAWDMGKFLYTQCENSKIPYPLYASRWVNIRKTFSNFYNVKWFNLRIMLGLIGQPFQGRPHDGLDDSRNIGNIVVRLLNDGCIIVENERILLDQAEQEKNAAIQSHERKLYSLCTVENINKSQFIRLYNWTWNGVPVESERALDKENLAAARPVVVNGNNGGGNAGNGNPNAGRGNKKRGKPKYKKWTEPRPTAEPVPVAVAGGSGASSSSESSDIIVVSAKILDEP